MKKSILSAATLRRWLLPALLLTGAATTAQAQNNVGAGGGESVQVVLVGSVS